MFPASRLPVAKRVRALHRQQSAISNREKQPAATQMVSLADEQAVRQILFESVMGLWEVVNNLTRLRPSRRERYRVAIFGSARAKPGTFVYDEVKRVAAALSEMGCDIVTGGGPGLMQAANEGAASVGQPQRSMGIRVDLPFEQEANPFVEQLFTHKTFFSRLHHFVIASDAFIVVPGGIGTVLETLMIWQLLQVRHVRDVPLIFVGKMWKGLVDWTKASMLGPQLQLANKHDLEIPRCLDTADQAIALLRDLHSKWLARQPSNSSAKS
ncbi:MAG: LOG family protein [Phycisphaerales bacterium]|nr:LOG family protein [Phycisphaerales bacterium]